MTVSELGSLGELIGSLAVLATLVYLAIQTRQTVKSNRQRSHSDLLLRRQDLYRLFVETRDVLDMCFKGTSAAPMDPIDAQRFTNLMISALSHVQDAYLQFRADLIDPDVWLAELRLWTPLLSQQGFINWWQHGQQFFTPAFVRVFENGPKVNPVLYDSAENLWFALDGGILGQDAHPKSASPSATTQ